MSQYTTSQTTPTGLIVNTVLDTEQNTTTYTVTAPNGTVATNTQSSELGGGTYSNLTALRNQLMAGGVEADLAAPLLRAVRDTTTNVKDQATTATAEAEATGNPPPAEKQTIPVSTVTNPQVPQPTNNVPSATEVSSTNVATTPAPAVDPQSGLTTANAEQIGAAYGYTAPTPVQGSIATDTTDPVGLGQQANSIVGEDPYNQAGAEAAYNDTPSPTEADVIASQDASVTQGFKDNANQQFTIAQQRKTVNNGDWRVKLRLAPNANYLYLDPDAKGGILAPLAVSDGVIFPYTPKIDTAYKANYTTYDLTHSNYRGYFYQNSYVDAVNITCPFTAQSTDEANYLLAVIHFFRSVTKMFYGQDTQRGAPPPLVYLSGLGEYQFNDHACVVSSFNYTLPSDVDYIRSGSPNINNTNLSTRRPLSAGGSSIFGGLLGGALNRLANAGAPKGGVTAPPPPPTLGLDRPTYVPTKMDISITLLPIQSRAQVSKQFSVKDFANGNLLKGGFW